MVKRKKGSNKFDREEQVSLIVSELGITPQLAKELCILAGGDTDLVIESSRKSNGLDHCKANIIDGRIRNDIDNNQHD